MNSLIKNVVKFNSLSNTLRIISSQQKYISTTMQMKKEAVPEHNPEDPIKFMGSGAQTFKARTSRVGTMNTSMPWIQPYSVLFSVAIFLIYFCILREENDIDYHLSKSLFDQVPGLEESTLISLYKYNLENHIDNTEVIKRMLDIGMDPMQIK